MAAAKSLCITPVPVGGGYLTPREKTAIRAMLAQGVWHRKVGRKVYLLKHCEGTLYHITITENLADIIGRWKPSTYNHESRITDKPLPRRRKKITATT